MRLLIIVGVFLGLATALPAKVKRDAPYPAAVPLPVPHETYGPPSVKEVEHTEDCVADGRWIDDVSGDKKTEGEWKNDVTGLKWSLDEAETHTLDTHTHAPLTHAPHTHAPLTHAPHTHVLPTQAPLVETKPEFEGKWNDDVTGLKWSFDETPDEHPKVPETNFVPVTHAPVTHTHEPTKDTEGKWKDDVTGRKWNLDEPIDIPVAPHGVVYNTEFLRHDLPHVKYEPYPAAVPQEVYGTPQEKQTTTTHDENCEADGKWINDVVGETEPTKPQTPEPEKPHTMYEMEIKYDAYAPTVPAAPVVPHTPYEEYGTPEEAKEEPKKPHTMYEMEIKYEPYSPSAAPATPIKPHEEYGTPDVKYAPYPAAVPVVKEVTHDEDCVADGRWINDVEGRKWNVDDTEPTKPKTPETEKPHTMYEMEIKYEPYVPTVTTTPVVAYKPKEEHEYTPYPAAVKEEPKKPHTMYEMEIKYEPYVPATPVALPKPIEEYKYAPYPAPVPVANEEPKTPHTMYEMEIKYAPYAPPAAPVTPFKPTEVTYAPYLAAVPLVKEEKHDEDCVADGRWINDVEGRKWSVDETHDFATVPETPVTHVTHAPTHTDYKPEGTPEHPKVTETLFVPVTHTPETHHTYEPTKEGEGKWTDDVTGRKWNVDDTETQTVFGVETKYAPYAPPATPVTPSKPHEEYGPPEEKFGPYPAAVPLVKETEHDEDCVADGRWINDLGKNYDGPKVDTEEPKYYQYDNLPKFADTKAFFKR